MGVSPVSVRPLSVGKDGLFVYNPLTGSQKKNRAGRSRTGDPLHPKQVR
jgi:hypothetical protein